MSEPISAPADRRQLAAVRPNLNRPGCLTVHPVLPSGRPDYGRVLRHTAPGESIVLADVTAHVLPGARRIHAGQSHKFPCAALVGRILPGAGRIPEPQASVSYNPRLRPDAFVLSADDGRNAALRGAAYALLQQRQAWVHAPLVATD